MNYLEYDLCPNLKIKPKPAFESQEAYERFREDFRKFVQPELEKYRIAHLLSIEASMHHIVD